MALRYSDVHDYVSAGLTALGYTTNMPLLNPGPPALAKLQKLSPQSMLFLTVGNGTGITGGEGEFDGVFIVARCIGPQNDYDSAEQLALDVDSLLNTDGNVVIGTAKSLYITRNGRPQLIDLDDADRYHFQATYRTEAQR